ncbi:DUF1499 domain-containing protein [Rhizobiaceae bacterium BDR2-2]|uniref:DUF1499 domain-containing protein n=1 Tax=Ectorhizobium quercum TaxID=2965071 RepID=A0AAE3N3C4_9HYPH|nr:DUF1499 domain-containing protein [Ectorhizobium quercum]MCX8998550.1 DUF1499 domain-containing protein [Ectorhizobium quercum]
MAIRFERPVSRSAFWARRLGFLAALLFLAIFAAFRTGFLSVPDFTRLALMSAGLAALAVLLAVIGLARLWQVGALGGIAAFRGLVYAAVPLTAAGIAAAAYLVAPPVYDLSTDPADPPPILKAVAADQEWLPRVQTQAGVAKGRVVYADLVGRRFDGAPDRVAAAVRRAARAARIVIVASEGEEQAGAEPEALPVPGIRGGGAVPGAPPSIPVPLPRPEPQLLAAPPLLVGKPGDVLFQGQTRTLIFGLPFDVVVRLREEEDNTLVDVRTVARYGDSDFGIGAQIIRAFLDALETEMLGLG